MIGSGLQRRVLRQRALIKIVRVAEPVVAATTTHGNNHRDQTIDVGRAAMQKALGDGTTSRP